MTGRTGARILVDALIGHGLTRGFGVPGESYLSVLDAMSDGGFDFVTCRHEGGAAMMADAVGKLTGRPGLCFVTRGPGATNASAGVHVASQDSTPLILFVGQIARRFTGRGAFQEVDYGRFFGGMAKWVVQIEEAARIPEIVARAVRTATQGRPGPVVVALPEDMLDETADVADAAPFEPALQWPGLPDMAALQKLLWAARRPVMLLGGSGWSAEAVAGVARFAERFDLPVATTFRRQMLFRADHPCFAGDLGIAPNPELLARVKASDLVLLVGGRLPEMPSQGYTLLDIPDPATRLVHVHPGAEELGRVHQPALAILASPVAFARSLEAVQPPGRVAWAGAAAEAHAAYERWSETGGADNPGPVQMRRLVRTLREKLPADAVICNGAGNYAGWIHRFYRFSGYGTQLAPVCGSMGYGLPAAIAAKRLHPERTVVALAGDGCFLMTGQELATAVQYRLPVVVIVVDNGTYGTIRMHQERAFPARVFGTDLQNPDFAAYAEAFGAAGFHVGTTDDFAPALDAALAAGRPALIHVRLDREAITPATSLTAIRDKALAGK